MATKKFAQMTTRKLNALMATASDEDKKAIEAVLAAREQAQAPKAAEETAEAPAEAPAAEETPLTPEEETAIKAAEENGSKATQEKKQKMTDEERHTLAEELKKNINHRCQAVPFNTAEWVDGYIVGVIEEKRSNNVLYAIKTDGGRRIVKVHDSNLLRIFDEVVEPEKKVRTRKAGNAEKVEWTPEAIATAVNEVIGIARLTRRLARRKSSTTKAVSWLSYPISELSDFFTAFQLLPRLKATHWRPKPCIRLLLQTLRLLRHLTPKVKSSTKSIASAVKPQPLVSRSLLRTVL